MPEPDASGTAGCDRGGCIACRYACAAEARRHPSGLWQQSFVLGILRARFRDTIVLGCDLGLVRRDQDGTRYAYGFREVSLAWTRRTCMERGRAYLQFVSESWIDAIHATLTNQIGQGGEK